MKCSECAAELWPREVHRTGGRTYCARCVAPLCDGRVEASSRPEPANIRAWRYRHALKQIAAIAAKELG